MAREGEIQPILGYNFKYASEMQYLQRVKCEVKLYS